jgi:hypothetical protein
MEKFFLFFIVCFLHSPSEDGLKVLANCAHGFHQQHTSVVDAVNFAIGSVFPDHYAHCLDKLKNACEDLSNSLNDFYTYYLDPDQQRASSAVVTNCTNISASLVRTLFPDFLDRERSLLTAMDSAALTAALRYNVINAQTTSNLVMDLESLAGACFIVDEAISFATTSPPVIASASTILFILTTGIVTSTIDKLRMAFAMEAAIHSALTAFLFMPTLNILLKVLIPATRFSVIRTAIAGCNLTKSYIDVYSDVIEQLRQALINRNIPTILAATENLNRSYANVANIFNSLVPYLTLFCFHS